VCPIADVTMARERTPIRNRDSIVSSISPGLPQMSLCSVGAG
jgi:hypothetical protein